MKGFLGITTRFCSFWVTKLMPRRPESFVASSVVAYGWSAKSMGHFLRACSWVVTQKLEPLALIGLEKICPICAVRFRSCEHCWRGHKYCSPSCSREGRKRNRRITEKRYVATMNGAESRRRRQKNFRNRMILGLKVTGQSPREAPGIIRPSLKSTSKASRQCGHCQKPIRIMLGWHFAIFKEDNYFSFTRFKSGTVAVHIWSPWFYESSRSPQCHRIKPQNFFAANSCSDKLARFANSSW